MKKYPVYLQDEEKACGAYCILMILSFFGFKEEIKEIKRKARLNQSGISIKGMIECLKSYQIESTAYDASLSNIKEQVKLPCILHMIYEGIGHFVVLYEINDDEYKIGDPARGLVTLYQEEMDEHYSLKMISIIHVGRVPELSYKPYYRFLYETMSSYKKHVWSLFFKGIWISLLGYLSSYFFQIILDYIHIDTKFFYVIVVCITYITIELIKTTIEKIKTKETIHLVRAVDEDYVFSSSMNMLNLPYSYFYQDKGYIQSQLLSLFDLSQMSIECLERLFLDALSFLVFFIGLIFMNIQMACVVLIMLMTIVLISYKRMKTLQVISQEYLESHFVYQHHLLELIENQMMIKHYSLLQKERERSYDIYLDQAMNKEKQALYLNQMNSMIQYIIYVFYGVILILGFYFYQEKALTIGQVLMFYMLMSYCIQPVFNIVSFVSQYKQMLLIYEKYKTFEKEEDMIKDKIQEKIVSIRLDNVGYAYGYELPIFEHIDFTISSHLIIKGETGCGKSTLLRLLMGSDLNYTGDIYFNNQELRDIDLKSMYQHVGYICQTPSFLHMSVFDNLLCHDEKKILKYLKLFHQENLVDMFHLTLSEDGTPLSLGQRQVIALIRTLCQDFDVIILDEAFSHMDQVLASRIQKYLLKDQNRIYIMVNHQTKLVKKNVEYAIMEKGRIRNEG